VTAVTPARRRALWLTLPLYLVLVAVLAVDVWAAEFWLRVGGQLGLLVAGAAAVVVLLAAAFLAVDFRRQWLLRQG